VRSGAAIQGALRSEKDTIVIVHVMCRGTSPILFNRMSESTLEGLRTKVKPAKAKDVGHVRTPREDAAPKIYGTDACPILPGENLMSCLIAAGSFSRLDAKRQISTAKSTLLPGLMALLDFVLPLVDPDTKKPAKWEPDVRKGTNPNGGEAVCICRPRFDRWAFNCRVEIDDQQIGENAIRQLWDHAGKRVGLGDFRPARKGIFGQFVVEHWARDVPVVEKAP
jgi:hypothetical protein